MTASAQKCTDFVATADIVGSDSGLDGKPAPDSAAVQFARLVALWPTIDDANRQAIIALAEAAAITDGE